MMTEIIQPNNAYKSEDDLENDLNKWIQEDSICFDVEINQLELQRINEKIEQNCIRASRSKYHTQIMELLRWWRSTLRTEINHLRYLNIEEFTVNDGFYCCNSQIGEFVCSIRYNENNRPTLYVDYIRYKPISKTCFNGKTYKIRLTESQLRSIIRESIKKLLQA